MENQCASTFENLLSREEIIRRVIEHWPVKREWEEIPVEDALGRVLVSDVCSEVTLPVVRASSRDGVAVMSSRFTQGTPDTRKWVRGVDYERADTGDDFDDRYDAVITIEDVEISGDGSLRIHEGVKVGPGENVCPAGSTVKAGEMLAKAGLPLRPRDLAGLQMGGIRCVKVLKKPVVAFIPSGSELIAPGTPLTRGKNIDTNSLLMKESLKELGAQALCFPIVRDDGEAMERALDQALGQADLVVMSGGSSKGEEDYTATLLHKKGIVLCHGAQAVPGKPLCAAMIGGKPVINLPGPFMAAYHGLEWCLNALVAHYLNQPPRRRQVVEAALTKPIYGSDMVSMLLHMEVVRKKDGSGYMATPCNIRETPMSRCIMANGQYMTKLNDYIPAGEMVPVELLWGIQYIPEEEDFEFDYIAEHIFAPIYPVIAEDIVRKAGRREGRLMDIGCGGGHLGMAVMEKTEFQGIFVDINGAALEIARDRAGRRGLLSRSEFLNRDVEHLELPDGCCDLIVSRGSYTFWNNLENALVELYRVLAPGGMTYIGGGMGNKELAAAIRPKMQEIWPEWPAPVMKRSDQITNEMIHDMLERHGISHEIIDNEDQGRWIVMVKKVKR